MKTFLLHLWTRLRTSFWFVPGLIVTIAVVAGYSIIGLDRALDGKLTTFLPHLEEVSADGVRTLLSTAATAVLSLAGLAFSSTLVALTLASSQYGGRLLRNFIRSVANQVTLGVLLGNFVFCLIVLRSVRSVEDGMFIPHIAALTAFVATLGSLAMFIFFIHHIAVSLQADRIVANVYGELDAALQHHFPDQLPDDEEERDADEEKLDWDTVDEETVLKTTSSGYVQAIDKDGLVGECVRLDLICRVLQRPGQFVAHGGAIMAFGRAEPSSLDEEDRCKLSSKVLVGRIRTAEQDFEYCLRQLVEVALRALSPGINDPFTAMNCIDFLGAALAKVSTRSLPMRSFKDKEGTTRVQVRPLAFGDLLDAAFHQIRQTAGGKTDIAIRILEALRGIAEQTTLPAHKEAVRNYAELIATSATQAAQADCDATAIREAFERVQEQVA